MATDGLFDNMNDKQILEVIQNNKDADVKEMAKLIAK